ncbi:DUF3015 domain-containing protein [Candidatus Nitrospira allomarina]|uniref:DUF3015 domain-containing protein n=1 Tax=Candidatus Nitrospira allomarina TaxID=3020900 RepID=A0AA96GJM7_9BACT|nr:DUF3015 domain-containing protein [Candidatus Nitrospira allomarina]WNM58856.1 DUF3015 domain-containing protein [Candidatus Nitrospira allomarina]
MAEKPWVLVSTFFLVMGMSGVAFGNPPNNGPGCGLGKLAWEDSSQKESIGGQVLMATTNGTFGSQTFGISSGTSGCTNDGKIFASEKVNVFAAVNFDNLAQEMAQGEGEHLTSLATLMGIPVVQQPAFFAMTQEKYTTLVQEGETSPKAVVKAIHEAMVDHPVLAQVTTSK